MKAKINCCKDCNNHSATCHSTCETYKTEKEELEKYKAEIRKKRRTYAGVDEHEIYSYLKHVRRKGKK